MIPSSVTAGWDARGFALLLVCRLAAPAGGCSPGFISSRSMPVDVAPRSA